MNHKETYTKIFLKELGKSINEANVRLYMPLWWQNTRQKEYGGLRLTDAGFKVLKDIGIETYGIPFKKDLPLVTQVIIFLDRHIDCPYYCTNKEIFLTCQKKAVEISLFSGDLRKYGLVKALSRQKEI